MMKLETINIILAVIVVALLVYIAYTHKRGENYRYQNTKDCDADLKEFSEYNVQYNPVWQNPGITSKLKESCGNDYIIGRNKDVPLVGSWTEILGGTHNANVTNILDSPMYQ